MDASCWPSPNGTVGGGVADGFQSTSTQLAIEDDVGMEHPSGTLLACWPAGGAGQGAGHCAGLWEGCWPAGRGMVGAGALTAGRDGQGGLAEMAEDLLSQLEPNNGTYFWPRWPNTTHTQAKHTT